MKKILFLEDEEILGRIYTKKLKSSGYDVLLVKNFAGLNEALLDFKADIVILDQGIKGEERTGIDFIPAIKEVLPLTYIIILSNYSKFHLEEKAIGAGADDYLLKINMLPGALVDYLAKIKI